MRNVMTANAYQTILNHLPIPVFLMDSEVRIQAHNEAAHALLLQTTDAVHQKKFGDALHCISSANGCGRGPECQECPIRSAVDASGRGVKAVRVKTEINFMHGGQRKPIYALITVAPIRFTDGLLHVVALEDVTELCELRQIIPICAGCKKIRGEDGAWEQIESYLHRNSTAALSHGLCPDCVKTWMSEERGNIQGAE